MSKMQKAMNLAAAASEPLRQKVQNEAQLQQQVQAVSEGMAKLSDESRSTLGALLGRMAEAQKSIQAATEQANTSAAALNSAASQVRGKTLLLAALAGWLAGVLSLLALLLWQPRPLLAALWNAAKALGTTQ